MASSRRFGGRSCRCGSEIPCRVWMWYCWDCFSLSRPLSFTEKDSISWKARAGKTKSRNFAAFEGSEQHRCYNLKRHRKNKPMMLQNAVMCLILFLGGEKKPLMSVVAKIVITFRKQLLFTQVQVSSDGFVTAQKSHSLKTSGCIKSGNIEISWMIWNI